MWQLSSGIHFVILKSFLSLVFHFVNKLKMKKRKSIKIYLITCWKIVFNLARSQARCDFHLRGKSFCIFSLEYTAVLYANFQNEISIKNSTLSQRRRWWWQAKCFSNENFNYEKRSSKIIFHYVLKIYFSLIRTMLAFLMKACVYVLGSM